MDRESRKHRSTANTAKLISSIILLVSLFVFLGGTVFLIASFTPTDSTMPINQLMSSFDSLADISMREALTVIGYSILLAWMGYTLRVMSCLLESQLPGKA